MSLLLAAVCDPDRFLSLVPLVPDLPSTERYVRGARAILQRILGAWIDDGQLLELEGRTLDAVDIAALRTRFARLAEEEDFVRSATVRLTLEGDLLTIAARIDLEDGKTYALEVTTGEAAAAIAALGEAA